MTFSGLYSLVTLFILTLQTSPHLSIPFSRMQNVSFCQQLLCFVSINTSTPVTLLFSLLYSPSWSSLLLYHICSEQLLASPSRACEPLGLNDFLLPPPVNSAPFDQANEIENFHLRQIDFKPDVTRG